MSTAAASVEHGFQRVLLLHTGERPEIDLLDCAARLSAGETTVAAYPTDGVLRSLAPAARSRFEVHGAAQPNLRVLTELNLDAAFEAASDTQADLLVMRHPRAFDKPRAVARRVLAESPCSVCLVPEQAPKRIERILAGIRLDESGRDVLAQATALYRSIGAEELIVVHSCFDVCSGDEEHRERFLLQRSLEMMRFMARSALRGVACTPVVEEGAAPHRALARVASERSADLLVVGRLAGATPRVSASLLWECATPLVQVLLPGPANRLRGWMQRIFSHSEPKFS